MHASMGYSNIPGASSNEMPCLEMLVRFFASSHTYLIYCIYIV